MRQLRGRGGALRALSRRRRLLPAVAAAAATALVLLGLLLSASPSVGSGGGAAALEEELSPADAERLRQDLAEKRQLLGAMSGAATPGSGSNRREAPPPPRVRSVEQLREACRRHAPELTSGASASIPVYGGVHYDLIAAPVCLHHVGGGGPAEVLVDAGGADAGAAVYELGRALGLDKPRDVVALTDAFFRERAGGEGVAAVPAVAAVVWGRYVANQFFHLVAEVLTSFLDTAARHAEGRLLRLPVQAVLLDGHTQTWERPSSSRALVRDAVNLISHAAGGPALPAPLPDAPVFVARHAAAPADAPREGPLCFCQALSVPIDGEWSARRTDVGFRLAADLAPKQFAAADVSRYWGDDKDEENNNNGGGYRPKALFLRRRDRHYAAEEQTIRHARETLRFRVAAVFPEELSAAEQYRLVSSADVLLGAHGLALTHVLWLGSLRPPPPGCERQLVEFLHWTQHDFVSDYQRLAHRAGVRYRALLPTDVSFGRSVEDPQRERWLLRRRGWREALLLRAEGERHERSSWWDQTVTHDTDEIHRVLAEAHARLQSCGPQPYRRGADAWRD